MSSEGARNKKEIECRRKKSKEKNKNVLVVPKENPQLTDNQLITGYCGDPTRTRTWNLLLRRQLLYPVEL